MSDDGNRNHKYTLNLDDNLLAAVKEEMTKKERQQRLHYFYLDELNSLVQECDPGIQHYFSQEILCQIATAILDGTLFQIVRSLREVQHLEEKKLSQMLNDCTSQHSREKSEMKQRQNELEASMSLRPHNIPIIRADFEAEEQRMTERQNEEHRRMLRQIVRILDDKVLHQQGVLEKSGLPGFYATTDPKAINYQMKVMEFVMKLSQKELPNF